MTDNPQDGMLAQILVKQGEMGMQLAVISERLKDLPDHETRLRSLEGFRWRLAGGITVLALASGAAGGFADHFVH